MDAQLRVGKVHIIEWLRPGDRRTGRELFGEVEPIGIMSKPQVDVAFHPVSTRAEFVALLRAIEGDFRTTGRLPLLHVETHGSDTGIGISYDEGFTFPDLMEELIPLNGATGLRLLVVLAACDGIWGIKMIQPADRAAVLALIGPNRRMDDDELAKAMQIFYRTIFREFSVDRAIRAMNDIVDPAKRTFGAYDAEKLFKDVYSGFLRERCTEAELSKRVASLFTTFVAQRFSESGRAPSAAEMAHFRSLAVEHISNHDERFEEIRRHFFWIDQFPENDQRFQLTLADCLRDD